MRTVAISEFKATCLALLEEVRTTGEPLVVTKRGVPIARIEPPTHVDVPRRKLGCMSGRGAVLGDLVAPVSSIDEWDAWQ